MLHAQSMVTRMQEATLGVFPHAAAISLYGVSVKISHSCSRTSPNADKSSSGGGLVEILYCQAIL